MINNLTKLKHFDSKETNHIIIRLQSRQVWMNDLITNDTYSTYIQWGQDKIVKVMWELAQFCLNPTALYEVFNMVYFDFTRVYASFQQLLDLIQNWYI